MRVEGDRRVGHAHAAIAEQIEIVFLVARIVRNACCRCRAGEEHIAQRFLRRGIGHARGERCRPDGAVELGIEFHEIGGVRSARIHEPGAAHIDIAAADRQNIAGIEIQLGVGAAKGAPAGQVGGPEAAIDAAAMRDGCAALNGDFLVRLRYAAKAIVAHQRHIARYGDLVRRRGVLRKGWRGGRGRQGQGEKFGRVHHNPFDRGEIDLAATQNETVAEKRFNHGYRALLLRKRWKRRNDKSFRRANYR